jgi:hypothetical protein
MTSVTMTRIEMNAAIAAILTLSIFTAPESVTLAADSSLAARFLDEAPKAWSQSKKFYLTLQGKVDEKQVILTGVGSPFEADFEFKCFDGNVLRHTRAIENGKVHDDIACYNSEYGFSLSRNSSNGSWQVKYIGKDKKPVMDQIEHLGAVMFVSYTIDRQSLPWTIQQPGFRLTSIRRIKREGADLIEVNFETTSYLREDWRITDGRVVLDPNHFWAVQEYDLNGTSSVKRLKLIVKGQINYSGEMQGFPIPQSCTIDYFDYGDGRENHSRRDYTYKEITKCNARRTDFTLSAFDLPEIVKPSKTSSHRWVWLLSIALVCLIAATALRFRLRRSPSFR